MSVQLFYQINSFTLRDRKRLKSFIQFIFKKEGVKFESLNVIFCSEDYLLEINRGFLKHDFHTDIITFNFSESGLPVIGEVYISADRVKENSSLLSVSFKSELHRVIFHGVLHLCGYKDKTIKESTLMRHKEDKYLHLYF